MNIEKILEYQSLDTEIHKLEQQLLNNPDQKAITKLQNVVKETQVISANLEKEAEKAVQDFQKLKKNYTDAYGSLTRLEQSQNNNYNESQCADCVKQLNNISSFLTALEKRIMAMADSVSKILAEYESAKQNYNKAKTKHAHHKAKLQKLETEILPKIDALKANLSNLESGMPENFLKKYKAKRQDNVFPVVVPLRENSCGGCGMELPSAQVEKLKKDGFLECENERCHRIIYFA